VGVPNSIGNESVQAPAMDPTQAGINGYEQHEATDASMAPLYEINIFGIMLYGILFN
jgi:hypothetical protein